MLKAKEAQHGHRPLLSILAPTVSICGLIRAATLSASMARRCRGPGPMRTRSTGAPICSPMP
jgi:hypothetical protein